MPLVHLQYFSPALQKHSALYAVVPDAPGPLPVVYLLHGLSDDHSAWQRRSSVERYAERHRLMVVMPDGARSYWCDARHHVARYEQHLLDTVAAVDRLLPTRASADGRGIGGLSMGGYGAMKMGLKHPHLFGSIAAHSGVYDIAAELAAGHVPELPGIFGDVLDPADDCFALAAAHARPRRGIRRPAIRFDCGRDDYLLAHSRRLHAHLAGLGIAHRYEEHPGAHDWEYWDAHLDAALRFHQQAFAAGRAPAKASRRSPRPVRAKRSR